MTAPVWAAESALPSLNLAYAYQPDGYGQAGWGPLTQPFGAGAYGPATLYSPPGLRRSTVPLGWATANVLAAQASPTACRGPRACWLLRRNTITTLSLAGLQQAELGNLYGRYGLAAGYQGTSATYVGSYAAQASAINTILRGMCNAIQAGGAAGHRAPPGHGPLGPGGRLPALPDHSERNFEKMENDNAPTTPGGPGGRLLSLPVGQAHAQGGQMISPCIDYAGYSALPSLQRRPVRSVHWLRRRGLGPADPAVGAGPSAR